MKLKNILILLIFLYPYWSFSISPIPANKQSNRIIILGGTIHIGNGNVITNKAIIIENGIINNIVDSIQYKFIEKDEVYNASNQHIYPGLILLNSILGLTEIEAVRASIDHGETGDFNPSSRSIVAYNSESNLISTSRSNGILLAQITPKSSGIFSGKSSIVQLDAWTWEDALVKKDDGIHMNWQSIYPPKTDEKSVKSYSDARKNNLLLISKLIHQSSKDTSTEELKSYRSLLTGKSTIYIHATYPKDIMDAYYFFKGKNINQIVIYGGLGCEPIIGFLKKNKIPVVLERLHSLPINPEMILKDIYQLPKKLSDSSIVFSLNYDGNMEAMGSRNLAFIAGTAVANGLSYEKAIQALTLDAAKIIGIDNKYGSIEVGKSGTLIISSGDILDIKTNKITLALIDGRNLILKNKQDELFERYKSK